MVGNDVGYFAAIHLPLVFTCTFVVTGPAFAGHNVASIRPDGVLVPSSTWKAVYDPSAGAAGVYVCTNTAMPRCTVVSVADLVLAVGIDPFPASLTALKSQAAALSQPAAARHPGGGRGRYGGPAV